MSTKERIRTIRLLEKVARNPAYAEVLGIEAVTVNGCPAQRSHSGSETGRRGQEQAN